MFCDICGFEIMHVSSFYACQDFSRCNGFTIGVVRHVCGKCFKDKEIHDRKCINCGTLYFYKDEIEPNSRCCYKCLKQANINGYSYKPSCHRLYDHSENDLCIGVELETNGAKCFKELYENSKNAINLFNIVVNNSNIINFAVLKRDGSIGYFGYELVSQPASLNIHKSNVPWKSFFDKYQLPSRKHCGLHFHVDRDYFNRDQMKLLDYIINHSVEIVSIIAGRKPNHYCMNVNKIIGNLGHSFSRYEMINFTNSKTIEFRFFKSPKSYNSFMYMMEFTDAICQFVKMYTIHNQECFNNISLANVWKSFFNFVIERKEIYSYLYKFLKRKKFRNEVEYKYNIEVI